MLSRASSSVVGLGVALQLNMGLIIPKGRLDRCYPSLRPQADRMLVREVASCGVAHAQELSVELPRG